jgi:hypothetical protein
MSTQAQAYAAISSSTAMDRDSRPTRRRAYWTADVTVGGVRMVELTAADSAAMAEREARAILERTEPEIWDRPHESFLTSVKTLVTWHERIHPGDVPNVVSFWALAESLSAVLPVLETLERESR